MIGSEEKLLTVAAQFVMIYYYFKFVIDIHTYESSFRSYLIPSNQFCIK